MWRLYESLDDHCPGTRCYIFKHDPDDARGLFHVPASMFHNKTRWRGRSMKIGAGK